MPILPCESLLPTLFLEDEGGTPLHSALPRMRGYDDILKVICRKPPLRAIAADCAILELSEMVAEPPI